MNKIDNIGKTAIYTADGECAEVVVLDSREVFGRTDYKVRYVVEKWVKAESLKFNEGKEAGQ